MSHPARDVETCENGRANDHNGPGRRLHAHRQARDDIGGMPRLAGFRNILDGTKAFGRVIIGDENQRERDRKADQGRDIVGAPANAADPVHQPHGSGIKGHGGHPARTKQSFVQRSHDVPARADSNEPDTDDGREDGDAAQQQRVQQRLRDALKQREAQHHGRYRRDRIGFKEIRRHARTVADVVADVVRDDRGISGIILRNSGLYFPHQIGPDVRCLRKDAAANAGEDRNQAATESQGQ